VRGSTDLALEFSGHRDRRLAESWARQAYRFL
jgi:hypothetical protein